MRSLDDVGTYLLHKYQFKLPVLKPSPFTLFDSIVVGPPSLSTTLVLDESPVNSSFDMELSSTVPTIVMPSF
jgi:hypothetical protein